MIIITVIQNFGMLDLVANGDLRLPPHLIRWPDFRYIRAFLTTLSTYAACKP